MKAEELAKYFDHTLLKPDATRSQIEQICDEAILFGFFSVCVNPVHVKMVAEKLAGSGVRVCSVVGFPLGAHTSSMKAMETQQAIEDGAEEIDMVINIGAMKEGFAEYVEQDIRKVVEAAAGNIVKVIIETCLLSEKEIVEACLLAKKAGAHFVKTSTGFAGGGATAHDVALMKRTVNGELQVKASGGIKSLADAEKMIAAGADRIGASAGIAILQEAKGGGEPPPP
ncbi:deoxyribose-phosphate aldolase [Desulfopila sp. IMCC35008]|uniref:deoxyribose-phosphate aldolase n=1 Tax=Desulfopila sp. IMCC35008 TaxID=2653858 RepID=UPI0013CF4FA2|nr:deoxyribose-phosphate aldolase [Desulfopila sp. IMCC35008]